MNSEASEKILVAAESSEFSDKMYALLETAGFKCERAFSGRDAQHLVYKSNFTVVILDINLSNYSSMEILKFIKLSKQKIKILLFALDNKILDDFHLSPERLSKLGVLETILPKNNPNKVVEKVEKLLHATSWKMIVPKERALEEIETKILDSMLTRIPIKETIAGNIAVFDHFIRLASNKYVKIVHQGEHFPVPLLQKYADAGCEYLYFLTKDRVIYINYMNELAQKQIASAKTSPQSAFKQIHNITEKYLEEVHTQGIRPDLVDEGIKICNNMYNLITKDKNIESVLKCLEEQDPVHFSHTFLVTFFSTLICKKVDWMGPRGVDTIAIGCLLHDIGQIALPPGIRDKRQKNFSEKEIELYKTHPKLGADMLKNLTSINEQVRQIIYQHHECVNGTGYPNALTGMKIYPLAKIVSLADGFSDFLVERKMSPMLSLRAFLQDRNEIMKYDAGLLRALVYGITDKG